MTQIVSLKSAVAELTSIVVTRSFCIGVAFVLQFAGAALGEGTYQRTKDNKTIVWNNDPKPGDVATWSGRRDPDGYADKFGTLTWYTASGTVYARFYGNMVRGKFEGMVNGHSKQKTAHAVFADGQRTTRWAAGPARSFSVAPTPPVRPPEKIVKTENAEPRNLSPVNRDGDQASGPNRRPKPEVVSEPAVPPAPTVDNVSRGGNAIPKGETTRQEAVRVPIQNAIAKEFSPQQAPSAAPAASPEKTPVGDGRQQAEPEVPAEGPRVAQAEFSLAMPSPPASEQILTPDSKDFGEQQNQSPIKEEASPSVQSDEDVTNQPPISEQKMEPDSSPQFFNQPPPSLDTVREAAVLSRARPRLTSEEVIKLANGEAHKHGYNRGDYRRDEPEFNPEFKTWSVSYEQSTVDGMVLKRFSVVVDDKTKGAIFLLRQ